MSKEKCKILEYAARVSDDMEGTPYQSHGQLKRKCTCEECMKEKEYDRRRKEARSDG